MPVLRCVSETADWLVGADKRSTLRSVVDRFLYLDLALGNDILLITSQVGFTIGVVIAPGTDHLSSAQPYVHRLKPLHPAVLALLAMQHGVPMPSSPMGPPRGAGAGGVTPGPCLPGPTAR